MRVTVTGATGLVGPRLVELLRERGDEVTVLSRDAARAREMLGDVDAHTWADPAGEPPPAEALGGRDGVIHLAGEPISQRWSDQAKRRIRASRRDATRNLVRALGAAKPRPPVLVSQSASGVYGPRGAEPVDEEAPRASGEFLADVAVEWEDEALRAEKLGMRVVTVRTGIVLSADGGALAGMLTPFKLGVGGPVAGGDQYVPWIHLDDAAGALVFCLDTDGASGPVNVTAPEPVTNRELSKTLGRVLGRPAVLPVPGFPLRLLLGDMSSIVTTGVRAVPKRLRELGYDFRHPELEGALRAETGRG